MDARQARTVAAGLSPWALPEADNGSTAGGMAGSEPGRVRIARRALRTVVREAALSIPGVQRLYTQTSGWTAYLGRPLPREGIALVVHGDMVAVDLYLVVATGINLVALGEAVQEAVGAAIEHIVGMDASEINVYIRDVA